MISAGTVELAMESYRDKMLQLPVCGPQPRQRGCRLVPLRSLPHRRHHLTSRTRSVMICAHGRI